MDTQRLALAGVLTGYSLMSPSTVAFALAVERATLQGQALRISDECIRTDIHVALRQSPLPAAEALEDLARRWSRENSRALLR